MGRSQKVESFDDGRGWVFNQERTRAARCRSLGSFDQYGLKQEELIEVWHVAAKRRIASYRHDYFEDLEGNIVSVTVSGVSFSEDGRELIIRYSDGDERRETFPHHFDYLPEINSYVDELREALTAEQVARIGSLDTTADLPGDTSGGAADSDGLIYLLADAACRRFAPPAFDAAGLPDVARRLRAMAPITSQDTAAEALEVCKTLEEGCDQEALTDVLSAAASAVEAARGFSSSAGGHLADVVSCAQKAVGEGTEITDAAIALIRELTELSRAIPLPRYVEGFVAQTCEVSELERLKKFYRSEITHILIDIRIGELSVPSYRECAKKAEHLKLSYGQKARQAEEKLRETDDPWKLKALARLNPFKKVQRPVKTQLRERQYQERVEQDRLAHQARKSKFSAFEKAVRNVQGAPDIEGRNQDYEHDARLRRAQMAKENKRKYEQQARDAEKEQLDYERLAADFEEKKQIFEQHVLQARQGNLIRTTGSDG